MVKWKVLRNCYGYKSQYWKEDTIVEFPDDATPPEHFERLDRIKVEPVEPEEPAPRTMSEINDALKPASEKKAEEKIRHRRKALE